MTSGNRTRLSEIAAALESPTILFKSLADGTGVILDLDGSRVLALNTTGMFVINQVNRGVSSIPEIVEALTSEFEVDTQTARSDLETLLADLCEHLPKTKD